MAQWKHRISIKDLFEDESSPELVMNLCKRLLLQLKPIVEKYADESSEFTDTYFWEIESTVDNFEFLLHLLDGTIPVEEWGQYGYEGDYEQEFNGFLSQLYDLGDIEVEKGVKFMWIG